MQQSRKSISQKNKDIKEKLNNNQQIQSGNKKKYEDAEYFEEELEKIKEIVKIPLMSRRLELHKEDEMEELMEVYQEVKEIETYLQKSIKIADFMILKHKTLLQDLVLLQEQLESLEIQRQTLEQQSIIHSDDMKFINQEIRCVQDRNIQLQEQIHNLNQDLNVKDQSIAQLQELLFQSSQTKIDHKQRNSQLYNIVDDFIPKTEYLQLQILSADRQDKINQLEKEAINFEQQLSQQQNQNEKKQQDLFKSEQQLQELKKVNIKLKEVIDYQKIDIEELQDKCEVLQEEYEKLKEKENNEKENQRIFTNQLLHQSQTPSYSKNNTEFFERDSRVINIENLDTSNYNININKQSINDPNFDTNNFGNSLVRQSFLYEQKSDYNPNSFIEKQSQIEDVQVHIEQDCSLFFPYNFTNFATSQKISQSQGDKINQILQLMAQSGKLGHYDLNEQPTMHSKKCQTKRYKFEDQDCQTEQNKSNNSSQTQTNQDNATSQTKEFLSSSIDIQTDRIEQKDQNQQTKQQIKENQSQEQQTEEWQTKQSSNESKIVVSVYSQTLKIKIDQRTVGFQTEKIIVQKFQQECQASIISIDKITQTENEVKQQQLEDSMIFQIIDQKDNGTQVQQSLMNPSIQNSEIMIRKSINKIKTLNAYAQTDLIPELFKGLIKFNQSLIESNLSRNSIKRDSLIPLNRKNNKKIYESINEDIDDDQLIQDADDPFLKAQNDLYESLSIIRSSIVPQIQKELKVSQIRGNSELINDRNKNSILLSVNQYQESLNQSLEQIPQFGINNEINYGNDEDKKSEYNDIMKIQYRSKSVAATLNGIQIEISHPDCSFCQKLFDKLNHSQCIQMKKKIIRQGNAIENKEEEFFRMCLLSFQLAYRQNQKILTLDYRSLFRQASQIQKLPFYMWNDWIQEIVERLQFEYIYKKQTEFEYAKLLQQRYQIQDSHF